MTNATGSATSTGTRTCGRLLAQQTLRKLKSIGKNLASAKSETVLALLLANSALNMIAARHLRSKSRLALTLGSSSILNTNL